MKDLLESRKEIDEIEYYKEKGVLRTETVSISINRMGKDVANDVVRDIKK